METLFGIDYPTWWFLVVGGLFSGYAILDGFDLGAGAWHLFFKREESRRIALNAVGPVWDGNEVWLVIGGGALFAGFPVMYAGLFSGLYIPLMLFLMFIILRAISIEFRSKEKMLWWRKMWDIVYSISSIVLAFSLGVVLGNVLNGIALNEQHEFIGKTLDFLNPFSILVGLTVLFLFMSHGGIYLIMKTEGKLYEKLTRLIKLSIGAFIISFLITTSYALLFIPHLSDDFKAQPWLLVFPSLAFLAIANVPRLAHKKKYGWAFVFTSLTVSFSMLVVAIELFPNLLIATNNPKNTITIYNAAASDKTLSIMMLMVAIGGPLVLTYTLFVYKTFKGKVKVDEHSY